MALLGRVVTLSLLEAFSNSLYSSFDSQPCACALFLDITKAFDSVNQGSLLRKLYHAEFRDPFSVLLGNVLCSRSKVVSFENIDITKISVNSEAPKGFVLFPLLFYVYVNDLWRVVSSFF